MSGSMTAARVPTASTMSAPPPVYAPSNQGTATTFYEILFMFTLFFRWTADRICGHDGRPRCHGGRQVSSATRVCTLKPRYDYKILRKIIYVYFIL